MFCLFYLSVRGYSLNTLKALTVRHSVMQISRFSAPPSFLTLIWVTSFVENRRGGGGGSDSRTDGQLLTSKHRLYLGGLPTYFLLTAAKLYFCIHPRARLVDNDPSLYASCTCSLCYRVKGLLTSDQQKTNRGVTCCCTSVMRKCGTLLRCNPAARLRRTNAPLTPTQFQGRFRARACLISTGDVMTQQQQHQSVA